MASTAAVATIILLAFATSSVRPFAFYRDRIPNGHNVQHPCDESKIWFGVGHRSDQGGNERNAFGLDFKTAGYMWTRDLCRKDSDGDGKTNGEELGDPQCLWQHGESNPSPGTGNITHPGFKTPVSDYPHDIADTTTLNCATFFASCKVFDDPDVQYIDLRIPNGTNDSLVPAKETTYFNWNFELPSDQVYHAVAFEPILDNLNVIHHFVMTSCVNPVPVDRGYESFNTLPGCESTEYIWSFGLGPECLPDEAGVAFGSGSLPNFVQLQLHWTNSQLRTDYRDTSGVRMYYTTKLRPHRMGTLWLGEFDLRIPPQKSSSIAASTCSSRCTDTLLDQGPIYLTSSFPHMHFLGKSLLVDHQTTNGHRKRIMDDKVYNYNSPAVYEYGPNYIQVNKGDSFHTTCEFNSIGRNTTTRWGFSSYEEMCFAFVRYYPRRGELMCTTQGDLEFCYLLSQVEGPRCSFFAYNENITMTVNRALTECEDVIADVQRPTPATTPVCSKMCLSQIRNVLKAHRDPCQQTRHKEEWNKLNSLIQDRVSILNSALDHCENTGTVQLGEQSSSATIPAVSYIMAMLATALLALL